MIRSIGLIVNPVAGVGGPAGLKGSDGVAVQRAALARGSVARAEQRAVDALTVVADAFPDAVVLTVAGAMGSTAVRRAGLAAAVVHEPSAASTSAADTTAAAAAIAAAGADLVLFVGGDGTARDVCIGLDDSAGLNDSAGLDDSAGLPAGVAALGVPAGVKMYSSCFAVSPQAAGALAVAWLSEADLPVHDQEVLDVAEEALRHGRVEPRLYGYLSVPYQNGRTQARKSPTPVSEADAVQSAACGAAKRLLPGIRYLLGPGSTMAALGRVLGLQTSPLGVDVLLDGRIVLADASEAEILAEIDGHFAQAVVTVIGGQGFLLGRGNQQLSARVIHALDPDEPVIVVATEQKLIDLGGRPLLVDTGDAAVDETLVGFVRVITGVGSMSVYPVSAALDLTPTSTITTQGVHP